MCISPIDIEALIPCMQFATLSFAVVAIVLASGASVFAFTMNGQVNMLPFC